MRKTLWRAASDDYVDTGYCFAEDRSVAKASNRGYGGNRLYRAKIDYRKESVLDWTDMTTRQATFLLDMSDPGAIGLDEWLPGSVVAMEKLRALGYLWVKVNESYPGDSTTWIWIGTGIDDEPELEMVHG